MASKYVRSLVAAHLLAGIVGCSSTSAEYDERHAPIPEHAVMNWPVLHQMSWGTGVICQQRPLPEDRVVQLDWQFLTIGSNVPEVHTETRDVEFRPNYVRWVDDHTVFVAGVSDDGERTLVELLSYSFEAGEPAVDVKLDRRGGAEYVFQLPDPGAARVALDTADSQHQLVTFAAPNLGRPNCVLLRFDSSGDICELELETGRLTTLASAHGAAPFALPAQEFAGSRGAGGRGVDDAVEGFVYWVGAMIPGKASQRVRLIDSDRDGMIDRVLSPVEELTARTAAAARR